MTDQPSVFVVTGLYHRLYPDQRRRVFANSVAEYRDVDGVVVPCFAAHPVRYAPVRYAGQSRSD